MKINFDKIPQDGLNVKTRINNVTLQGIVNKKSAKLLSFYGKITGDLDLICDRCGVPIKVKINEDVNLILSNGEFKEVDGLLSDVIEFYDNQIEIDDILISEVEAFKSDYFYCDKCNFL